MPSLRLDGARISYRDEGSGPPVILAHCSLAHSGLWKPVIGRLAPAFRVLAPDMPAHGASDPPPAGASLQLHAARACRTLMESLDAPAHLVGLSLGGAVLARAALMAPARVASLTLIEPVFFYLLERAGRPEAAAYPALTAPVQSACRAGDFHSGARAFMESWGMPGKFDSMDQAGRDYVAGCLRHLAADFALVDGFPPAQLAEADLARLPRPVMLVAGARTQPFALAVNAILAGLLQDARVEIIPGAGHLSPISHPDAVIRLLRDFWRVPG
jgi:pimeloyl-ACP methyl ester carboxylesterase